MVDDLVGEILGRIAAHAREVDRIHGGHDGFDFPSRMDLILERTDRHHVAGELLEVADRICVGLDQTPGSVGARHARFTLALAAAGVSWEMIGDAMEAAYRDDD